MARTRAVPRRRPNINFQQRGNIDFERQRVAATRNISSTESSAASSAAASPAGSLARSPARSPLGNLARNLARDIGRNPQRNQARSPPIRSKNKICFTKSQKCRGKTSRKRCQKDESSKSCKTRC